METVGASWGQLGGLACNHFSVTLASGTVGIKLIRRTLLCMHMLIRVVIFIFLFTYRRFLIFSVFYQGLTSYVLAFILARISLTASCFLDFCVESRGSAF